MNYYNYFTEIEEHFVRKRGKHLLISPIDWALIAAWRDAGVPLQVALRGIDIAMDKFMARKRRPSAKINSLCYCHDSVMAEFAEYLECRVGEQEAEASSIASDHTGEDQPAQKDIQDLLSARIAEIKELTTKQSLGSDGIEGIGRVLARLQAIAQELESGRSFDCEALERDLNMIDELLVAVLRNLVAPEETAEWEKEAKKELKVYRKRLPSETYQKIWDGFMRRKIHKKFGIGELSIFSLS